MGFFSYAIILLAAVPWVTFVEWTFYLIMAMSCPDAGEYGRFHRGVIEALKDFIERLKFAYRAAHVGFLWKGNVTGKGLSEGTIDVQGEAIPQEASFLPPYSVRLPMFIFLVLLMYYPTGCKA
jgi:hypothetical protein